MIDLNANRKIKVNLADYDHQGDIKNRLLMASFSTFDLQVLEEILYSSLKISKKKLSQHLQTSEEALSATLQKFQERKLLFIEKDTITVDKQMRKYFESQMQKFSDDFIPDMEYLQHLLKKVPIHVLPIWYSIPRSSNNIFESIIEKYLLTPQLFQRHIAEFTSSDPILAGMLQNVFDSPNMKLPARQLREKYLLSRESFEEIMLKGEFHFALCLSYEKIEGYWEEMVSPLREWQEYLHFLRKTEALSIKTVQKICLKRPSPFSFVEEMTLLLKLIKKKRLSLSAFQELFTDSTFNEEQTAEYFESLLHKILLIQLAHESNGSVQLLRAGLDWLKMSLEERALALYRHPCNSPSENYSERTIKEAEKTILRALHKGWIYFDDFFLGVDVALSEKKCVLLKRSGKGWHYEIPEYSQEDKKIIRMILLEWFFESGITQVGTLLGKDVFYVTPLGHKIFAH
jgi:hypothetical protein